MNTLARIGPSDFSTNLFWDIDPETLDMERHSKYIVARVLEFGTFDDWLLLCRYFTLPVIIEKARTLRTMDSKSLAFISAVGNVSKELFRCCTSTPLTSVH